MRNLTEKEKCFCRFYAEKQNLSEAAVLAGYRKKPEKTAMKMMKDEDILAHLESIMKEKQSRELDLIQGLNRLAFGCVSDAVTLAFSDEIGGETLKGMDLFNIHEIKVQKGKGVEIKFFDRLKALEKLSEALRENRKSENDFFSAIALGAGNAGENSE